MLSINTTALARKFHITTKDVILKLEKKGLEPLQRTIMPSGRTYCLWDEKQAEQALQAFKPIQQAPAPAEQAPELKENETIAENQPSENNQENDLQDIKTLLNQILEVLTKPKSEN